MNKEKILHELSKMSPMIIETAYLYAAKLTLYGVDVTEKWETATQNASTLEKAYKKGYYDALERLAKSEGKDKEELRLNKIRAEIERKARPNEIGSRVNGKSIRYGLCMALEIIDKYKSESEGTDASSD